MDQNDSGHLRAALETARVGVWVHHLRTGSLSLDRRCKELFGLPPAEDVTHALFVRALHPADRHHALEAIERAQQPGAAELEMAFRVLDPKDQTGRRLTAFGRVFADAQGTPVRLVAVVIDVSEEQRAREELKRAVARAERAHNTAKAAEQRKDEFLAMLGHELRNPLAPILTALQLMKLKDRRDSERERTIIERQVRHLERLIEDLLDVSRLTRGMIELRKQPVELGEVVAAAIELASPLIEQKRHRLEVNVPSEGLLVDADQVRLAQVVANLLMNAAKYTDDGGHIAVVAGLKRRRVVLRIRDSGAGIAPELLPHVFELFTQAPQTLARARGGLGLGLAIVKGLVEMHGGTVVAYSDGPGHGSELVVRLPALGPSEARDSETTPRAFPAFREGTERRRIVVVDDNRDAAEALGDALAAVGHEVQLAFDGPTALELTGSFRPDTVLLDIGLPVMDGYEVARRLRTQEDKDRRRRLIAITGYGQDQDRADALAAGFDMHLVKPVDLEILMAAIDFERRE